MSIPKRLVLAPGVNGLNVDILETIDRLAFATGRHRSFVAASLLENSQIFQHAVGAPDSTIKSLALQLVSLSVERTCKAVADSNGRDLSDPATTSDTIAAHGRMCHRFR